jgi:hypothetical protein
MVLDEPLSASIVSTVDKNGPHFNAQKTIARNSIVLYIETHQP